MPTPEELKAEEDRQNQALLDSYDPQAQAEPMPAVLPAYYQDKARQGEQDLVRNAGQEALRPATTPTQAPAKPAPAQAETGPTYQDEPAWASIVRSLSGAAGGLVKSYGAYKTARDMQHGGYVTGSGTREQIDRLGESGNQAIAQASQAEAQRQDASRREQRQAWLDKNAAKDRTNAAEDRTRRMGRENLEDKFSAEAHDKDSTKSKNLRAEVKQAFPDFAKAMGADFDSMSVYDFAHTPHPGLAKAKFDAQTDRLKDIQGTRQAGALEVTRLRGDQASSLEDKRQTGRVELKKTPKAGGAGGHGGGQPADLTEYEQALADEFGGKDKIPPALLAALHAAGSNPDSKQRATAIRTVMSGSHGANMSAGRTQENQAGAYGKEAEPAEKALAWAKNLRKELHAQGIDPDNYQGQDIPGFGRLNSYMPDAVQSAAGQRMRAAVGGEIAGLILDMSGKASSEQEANRLRAVAGAMKGGDPKNIIWGMHQLEDMSKATLARASTHHPRGSQAAAGPGPIRVRDSKGQTGSYSGTAEEAKAEGFEVIQ